MTAVWFLVGVGCIGAYLRLLTRLNDVISIQEATMSLIDDLLTEVTRNSTIGDSVLALVQRLVDQAGGDPVKLQAALDALKADSDKLEAAVIANTPQS